MMSALSWMGVMGGAGAAAPVLTSMNYAQGDTLGGGEDIVLTGTGFTGATDVDFGGSAAVFVVDSDTQITCTLPAHAAGAVNVTVTGPGGTSGALPFEYWDPGQLTAATGVWEDYGGSPWTARGGSVGGDVSLPVGATAVSVGAGSGGFSSADTPGGGTGVLRTDGTNFIEEYISMRLSGSAPGPGTTAWVLFKPDTAGTDGGTAVPYENRALLSTNAGGYFFVSHTVNGFVAGHYDGSYDAVTAPCSLGTGVSGLGAFHMGVFVADGTNIQASVDGSPLASASSAQILPPTAGDNTYRLQVCSNYSNGAQFDGEILAFGLTKDVSTDADVTKLRAWAQQRFGVAV